MYPSPVPIYIDEHKRENVGWGELLEDIVLHHPGETVQLQKRTYGLGRRKTRLRRHCSIEGPGPVVPGGPKRKGKSSGRSITWKPACSTDAASAAWST